MQKKSMTTRAPNLKKSAPLKNSRSTKASKSSIILMRDIKTNDQKIEYWKVFDNKRERFIRAMKEKIASILGDELNLLNSIFTEDMTMAEIDAAMANAYERTLNANWEQVMKEIYGDVSPEFARTVFASVSAGQGLKPARISPWTSIIRTWIRENAGMKIVGITETTRNALRAELAKGFEQGETITQIMERIDKHHLKQIIPFRSETIARTEVIQASNLGSRAGALATRLDLVKEWVATPGLRTREGHMAAHGQRQDMNKPYIVNGEKMMFPGDPTMGASASNIINCRCTEVYYDRSDPDLAEKSKSLIEISERMIMLLNEVKTFESKIGTARSGNWGHTGRPGVRGGSGAGGTVEVSSNITDQPSDIENKFKKWNEGWESDTVQNFIAKVAGNKGKTKDEFITDWEKKIKTLCNEADVCMRVDNTTLDNILKSNAILTQHDTGKSRGLLDLDIRTKSEELFFGKDANPHYGYLRSTGPEVLTPGYTRKDYHLLDQYGTNVIVFKPGIKEQTTWSIDDSLDANRTEILGMDYYQFKAGFSLVSKPTIKSAGTNFREFENFNEVKPYAEAQIHGKLDLTHVAAIETNRKFTKTETKILAEHGIEIRPGITRRPLPPPKPVDRSTPYYD